jgi:hypothetical protein
MEFTDKLQDLEPETTHYGIMGDDRGIDFLAYTDKTAVDADPNKKGEPAERAKMNAYVNGYFLRKGFSKSIDFNNVGMYPEFVDQNGRDVNDWKQEEVMDQIYDGKLALEGFKYMPNMPTEEKEKAFKNIISEFVHTSLNNDFIPSEKGQMRNYEFHIQNNAQRIIYNNKNPQQKFDYSQIMSKVKENLFNKEQELQR